MEALEAELHRVRRQRELAVLMLDLDRFKRINDETGHARGDELLKAIARTVESAVRATDVVGRYGGDELVILLPDTGADAATAVATRIVEAVRETGAAFDAARAVTASIGIAQAQPKDGSLDVLRRADEAAYGAKAAGGDRVTARAA
jgi:two-component system cell cycle response regulator